MSARIARRSHRARRGPRRGQSGFTLLEVLIAFAILSVAVVAVIQGFAQGLRLLKVAGDHQQAVLLADQKIRELVTVAEGRDQGKEGNYDWERTVTVVPAPDLTRTQATAKWHVYQIDVKVSWGDKRGVEIVSLRTSAGTTTPGTTSGPPRAVGTPVMPGASTPAGIGTMPRPMR
jgi:general secretion pathway protein I